jgi:hypothetical protein
METGCLQTKRNVMEMVARALEKTMPEPDKRVLVGQFATFGDIGCFIEQDL